MVSWCTVTALAIACGPRSSAPPEMLDWEPSANKQSSLKVSNFCIILLVYVLVSMCLTLSTVRLLLHEVVAGPEGHEVGVVGGGGDGDGPGAAHVGVAQLVGQLLQLVSLEPEEI